MEKYNGDFVNLLDPDVSSKILMCLDDPADVARAGSVSSSWRDFIITNGICKHLCLKLFPQLCRIAGVNYKTDTSEKSADVGCSSSAEWEHSKRDHRMYTSLARGLTSSEVGGCVSDALNASSTDNFPEEGISHTLESRDRIGRRASYWSSSGQSNSEVPEKLTYRLISDICVITEINIQPFQAFFQADSPIYSSKAVRFRMGHMISPDEEKYAWTYISEEFPMLQVNSLQNFKLSEPVLCIGGILQIELLGRIQRQEMDGLFYICIAHVQVVGRSLSPVFGVEAIEPSGRFVLTYNPEAQFTAPSSIEDYDPDKTTVTPEMLNRHVRGWEQILNMLRGTLGVEVYDSDDEHQEESDEEMVEEFAA